MLVRVLKRHFYGVGDDFERKVGTTYDHPSPRLLIDRGKVEAVDGPIRRKRKAARRKKA